MAARRLVHVADVVLHLDHMWVAHPRVKFSVIL